MADTTKPLAEKIALVTGGSRGIGAAICQRLAAAGAHITLTYAQSADAANSVTEACRRHAGKAVAVRVDAGDVAAGQRLVNQMVADAGRIDILVNNAATLTLGDLLTKEADCLQYTLVPRSLRWWRSPRAFGDRGTMKTNRCSVQCS